MNQNTLYPVFLKLNEIKVLIIGAGAVGYEKLFFILKNSPDAQITLLAKEILPDVRNLLKNGNYRVEIIEKAFEREDISGHDLIVAATAIDALNINIRTAAKLQGKLINVADSPALCDFYLGSIVSRGPLKIAISTNGQSPTLAKRIRQTLEAALPIETASLIQNLKVIRDRLTGDFSFKVKRLNDLTSSLIKDEDQRKKAWQ